MVVFLRAKTGLFCVTVFFEISRYLLCSEKMCDERLLRCLKLLPSGAKRHLSKSCRYRNRKNTFCDYCCTLFYGVKPLYLAFLDVPWWVFSAYKFSDNRGVNKSKSTENYIEWLTTIELTAKQVFKSVIALQASATFLRSFLGYRTHDFARG